MQVLGATVTLFRQTFCFQTYVALTPPSPPLPTMLRIPDNLSMRQPSLTAPLLCVD